MAEIKSHCEKLELIDGTTVDLTINFKKLYYLKSLSGEMAKDVDHAMKLVSGAPYEILEVPPFLWVAYCCAVAEPAYDKDEFIGLVPFDVQYISEIFANLIVKKKV